MAAETFVNDLSSIPVYKMGSRTLTAPIFCCPHIQVLRMNPHVQINTYPAPRDAQLFLQHAGIQVNFPSSTMPPIRPFGIIAQRNPFAETHPSGRWREGEGPGRPRRFVCGPMMGRPPARFHEVTQREWDALGPRQKGVPLVGGGVDNEIGLFRCEGKCGARNVWGLLLFEFDNFFREKVGTASASDASANGGGGVSRTDVDPSDSTDSSATSSFSISSRDTTGSEEVGLTARQNPPVSEEPVQEPSDERIEGPEGQLSRHVAEEQAARGLDSVSEISVDFHADGGGNGAGDGDGGNRRLKECTSTV